MVETQDAHVFGLGSFFFAAAWFSAARVDAPHEPFGGRPFLDIGVRVDFLCVGASIEFGVPRRSFPTLERLVSSTLRRAELRDLAHDLASEAARGLQLDRVEIHDGCARAPGRLMRGRSFQERPAHRKVQHRRSETVDVEGGFGNAVFATLVFCLATLSFSDR